MCYTFCRLESSKIRLNLAISDDLACNGCCGSPHVLYNKGKELSLIIHAAGNIEDHVHIVVSIPPKLAVANCVRHLKGASAYTINHMDGSDGRFKWQGGYGALTVGERSLEIAMEYAAKQKEHHRENKLIAAYERIDEEE